MKKPKFRKLLALVLVLTIVLSNMPMVFAETNGVSANNMLSFFKDGRTNLGLNVDNISIDEAYVYGMFLSNFFIPGSTTQKTIAEPDLAETVSAVFFGSKDAASADLQKLNAKIANAINHNLITELDNFFYSDSAYTVQLDGDALLLAFAQSPPSNIYFRNQAGENKTVSLADPAMHAAFKIIFGIVPELFTKKSTGIASFEKFKMDAWGNIWGQRDAATFVLIIPSALNPMSFENKLPVTNSFAMGAFADISYLKAGLSAKDQLVPYYAIAKTLHPADPSITSIVAIASPHDYVGNTNKIIVEGSSPANVASELKTFVSEMRALTEGVRSDFKNINFLVNSNLNQADLNVFSNDLLGTYTGTDTEKALKISGFTNYFMATVLLQDSQIASRMHYFGSSGNSLDSWHAAKLEVNDYSLLFNEQSDPSGGTYPIPYTDSYKLSPFLSTIMGITPAFTGRLDSLNTYATDATFAGGTKDKSAIYVQANNISNSLVTQDANHRDVILGLFPKMNDISLITTEEKNTFTLFNFTFTTWGSKDVMRPLVYGMSAKDTALAGAIAIASPTVPQNDVGVPMLKSITLNSGVVTEAERVNYIVSGPDEEIIRRLYKKPFQYHLDDSGIRNKHHTQLYDEKSDEIDGMALTLAEESAAYTLFNTLYVYNLIGMEQSLTGVIKSGNEVGRVFNFHDGTELTYRTTVANKVNDFAGIYWSYMVELLGVSVTTAEDGTQSITASGLRRPSYFPLLNQSTIGLNKTGFDDADSIGGSTESGGVNSNREESLKDSVTNLIKKVQDFLSPEPSSDRDNWLKSVITGFILQTHNDMVGKDTRNTNALNTGKSAYVSTASFLTNPNLHDIPVANWFVNNYIYIYIGLMIITGISLSLFVVSGQRKLTHSLLIFVFMGVVFLLPHTILNVTTQVSNKIGNQVYSSKFDYWTLLQHQQYQKGLDSASTQEDYALRQNSQKVENAYSDNTSVKVKWMSPKKGDAFAAIFSNATGNSTLTTNLAIFKWLFSSFIYQEEYIHDDPLATYLYRPYNAIVVTANSAFNELATTGRLAQTFTQQISASNIPVTSPMFTRIRNVGNTVPYADAQKYVIGNVKGTNPDNNVYDYAFWGLTDNTITTQIFKSRTTIEVDGYSNAGYTPTANGSTMGHAFLLQTESPFYYFYNSLKARYGTGSEFKRNLISENFFTITYAEIDEMNTQLMKDAGVTDITRIGVNTEQLVYATRDFLDMEGMFTYLIPYLKQANTYVHTWGDAFGMQVDTFDFNSAGIQGETDEERKAFENARDKKKAVERVWNLYSPWVQALYDTSYAIDTVYSAKEKTMISDAFNPDAYTDLSMGGSSTNKGRSMVFSEADMLAKNYDASMLTTVELRIQNVLKKTEKDMYYLMNYYDLDDEVLLSAAAMLATFNFNAEFSESKLIGKSVNLYPVGYELKNFNYDAYMRMALMNATGEGVMDKEDLYVRILGKTSILTGFFLLIVDFLGVIVIPTMRIMALLLLLAVGVLQSITCVLNPPEKIIKSMLKNVVAPSVMFLAANIFLIILSSLFIGEGLTGYTGSRGSSMPINDPTLTLVLLAFVSAVYVVLLFKIMNAMVQTGKLLSRQAFFGGMLAVAGGVTTMTGGILKATGDITGGALKGINDAINPWSPERNRNRGIAKSVERGLEKGGLGANRTNTPLTAAEKAQQKKNDAKGEQIGAQAKEHADDVRANQKKGETSTVETKATKTKTKLDATREQIKSKAVNVTGDIKAKAQNIRQEANKVLSNSQVVEQTKRMGQLMGDTAQGAIDTIKDKTKTAIDSAATHVTAGVDKLQNTVDKKVEDVTASVQKIQKAVDAKVADINAQVLQPTKERILHPIKATGAAIVRTDAQLGEKMKNRLDKLEANAKTKTSTARSSKYT